MTSLRLPPTAIRWSSRSRRGDPRRSSDGGTLGAERSHPASVAQAAFYTLGEFGQMRDAVIATMDTGSRTWDYERIPAERL